ncbi:hypothetical protein ACPV5S_13745 [Vibrio astriarenae]
MLKKWMIGLLTVVVLQGCASSGSTARKYDAFKGDDILSSKQEHIMKMSGNWKGLIPLYKQQLQRYETDDVREKLGRAYLMSGDPESAIFTIEPILENAHPTVVSRVIHASALFDLGDSAQAKKILVETYRTEAPRNGEIENLLGIIHAQEHEFDVARDYFNLARRHYYNDNTVRNNLAVVDILENKHETAVRRLASIDMKGKRDPQLEANLAIAMAKRGEMHYVRSMLDSSLSKEQASAVYEAIRDADLTAY